MPVSTFPYLICYKLKPLVQISSLRQSTPKRVALSSPSEQGALPLIFVGNHGFNLLEEGLVFLALFIGTSIFPFFWCGPKFRCRNRRTICSRGSYVSVREERLYDHLPVIRSFIINPAYVKTSHKYAPKRAPAEARLPVTMLASPLVSFLHMSMSSLLIRRHSLLPRSSGWYVVKHEADCLD